MRVLLAGLGSWGALWQKWIERRDDLMLAGVIEIGDDAGEAMDRVKPDFVLNATPPTAHKSILDMAFDRNIPVLSEKPIAESHEDVLHIAARAQNGQKLMIAENYRYMPEARRMNEQLRNADIGEITEIQIDFGRRHTVGPDNYHMRMEHPMLLDVGIHHLDLLRRLTGNEAKRVSACFHVPAGSKYRGYCDAAIRIEMENGAKVVYNASLDTARVATGWLCHWVFTGEKGKLRFAPPDGAADSGIDPVLDAFIAYVRHGIVPETHISDNLKTYNIAHAALTSFETGKEVEL
jgi:predicted dehydrogenase